MSLAVPAALQSCLELWALELGVTIGAGLLPDAEVNLGANAALACIGGTCYMLWVGLQVAASITVGTGDAAAAQRAARVSVCIGLFFALLVYLVVPIGRFEIAGALTDDAEVKAKVAYS
ncbi:unnamed protein product [Prorocentrum cordatum]|uniref:MATE family efflux transporter n=1 Tax=Prorocentrum cordatum TaxID=2364126 RepID=A0ABN9VX18_9DINO|nr:unnamed protein product [Polarella glacialis]